MTIAKTNLVNTFTNYVKDFQTKINTINSQLKNGKATLTTAQQDQVTQLSATAQSYSTPQASITAAQNTIGVAQTAIKSILPIMNQMQQLAAQATDPTLQSMDSTNLDFRFQQLVTQIGKLATTAGLNGTNLLSGTAGMNVIIGTDKTAASRSFVNPVDIYGMMTIGLMSGVKLDTPEHAQAAMTTLNSALMQIVNGQALLKSTSDRLTKQATKLTGLTTTANNSINAIQNIDPTKLKAQLAQLQSQQNVDYQLIQQLDPNAYKALVVANAKSANSGTSA
jgi:flagellin-like hook-associated protein FlgL